METTETEVKPKAVGRLDLSMAELKCIVMSLEGFIEDCRVVIENRNNKYTTSHRLGASEMQESAISALEKFTSIPGVEIKPSGVYQQSPKTTDSGTTETRPTENMDKSTGSSPVEGDERQATENQL